MLTLEQRVLAVCCRAWQLLPPIKHEMVLAGIHLEDLGAQHGSFDPDTCLVTLSTRLFLGNTPDQLMTIDCEGNCPAQREPFASRALHTATHELVHAIGYATGADSHPDWLDLSGWEATDDDLQETGRYRERRPGWGTYDSAWRYTQGVWFPREYASASPYEDFADCATHIALGWTDSFLATASGRQKLLYLRRVLWQESGAPYLVQRIRDLMYQRLGGRV